MSARRPGDTLGGTADAARTAREKRTVEAMKRKDLTAHLFEPRPKRILALNGGGIRGILTPQRLKRIEKLVRDCTGNDSAVLADYVDLIGGTSTGAIIVAVLASGFYVNRDYYNGINVAYMYTQRADLLPDRFDAIVSYGHANVIRRHVIEICQELIEDEVGFASCGDKEWVYLTLAEAFQGLGQTSGEERLEPKIQSVAMEFGKRSYLDQKTKLKQAMDEFECRMHPDKLSANPDAGDVLFSSQACEGDLRRALDEHVAILSGGVVRPQPHHHRCRHRAGETGQVNRDQLQNRIRMRGV